MIPVPLRTGILFASLESTLGTAESLAGGDAGYRVINPQINPIGTNTMIPAGTGNADIGAVAGPYNAELTFDMMLYEGGWRSIFFPAMGFSDDAVTDEFIFVDDYTLWQGLTAGVFFNRTGSKKFGIFGAMGAFTSIRFPAGAPAMASFRFRGRYKANPGTLPTGITWETTLPPTFDKANSLSIGGDATIACADVELTADDYPVLIPSPNATGGFVHAWHRKPQFRFRVSPLETTAKDWIADALAGTNRAISIVLNGGTGNKITVSATCALANQPRQGDLEEMMTRGLELAVLNNTLKFKFE